MSKLLTVAALRERRAAAKQADEARNVLLDDLLQKVDDMQKTMDRNAFILVLIDGDCMNFLDELVKDGIAGGEEAARRLRRAVFDDLRYDEDFQHDQKIVIRVYANLRGLSKAYADSKILSHPAALNDFVLGFNKAHPLCDFIDAGNHKEAADTKLKESLSLYIHNVHCKQIIFGASADNGYAAFLNSFSVDEDVTSRIRLLKGPPFSREFEMILSKFKTTEFTNVFNREMIPSGPVQTNLWRKPQDVKQPRSREAVSTPTVNSSSIPWRPRRHIDWNATKSAQHDPSTQTGMDRPLTSEGRLTDVDQDSDGEGVNISSEPLHGQSPAIINTLSGHQGQPQMGRHRPVADAEVESALIRKTNERLKETPKALDFSVVKLRVEQELGLAPSFWGQNESNEWFSRSKNIIKIAIEDWVERTNNLPPKNATWMPLDEFATLEKSPSSIMKDPSSQVWRTKRDSKPSSTVSQNQVSGLGDQSKHV